MLVLNDLNGDGAIVTVADILVVYWANSIVFLNCTADVDDDGAVTVSDLLLLLAAFGNPC